MRHDDLADGTAGRALYEMVAARTSGTWEEARSVVRTVASRRLMGHPDNASLYYGVPTLAYVLAFAEPPAFTRTLADLESQTVSIVHARLKAAQLRMASGHPPRMREYDLISGLTGLGAYLLLRGRRETLKDVLRYLVRLLTEPLTVAGHTVPGWWTSDGPKGIPERDAFSLGHANFGIAHGMPGPLALLALSWQAGVIVAGQDAAIDHATSFLTTWAQPSRTGNLQWPELLPLHGFLNGPTAGPPPGRPSWCYGTAGICRALQRAALARGNEPVRRFAERVMLESITDPEQLARLTDATLCHGWAGLLLSCTRIAADATTLALARELPRLRSGLSAHAVRHGIPETAGLLTGSAGVQLTLHTLVTSPSGSPGWETCLLLN